ncbi:MAG: molybdopterin-guanine dinucleotide biosynthesis protein B [Desulfococcus sp. 4484_242]|nr:MAG: molybdopterin-guanine dinucleotide biosynthesis protein B [Desulfococcus sp. 4484_242]
MKSRTAPPVVSIVGFSGSGKTTLLEKLIRELIGRGCRVGTIKHDVHGFDLDRPGKDSWRHKQAGAVGVIISSPRRIGMVMDVDHDHHPEELKRFFPPVDIILTEGYKQGTTPKIEIFRLGLRDEPLCREDPHLIGIVTDANIDIGVPRFSLEGIPDLAGFLIRRFSLIANRAASRT